VKLLSLNDKIKAELEDYYFQKFNIHIDDFRDINLPKSFTQKAFIVHDALDEVVLV